jgi:hypothetical protein
MGTLLMTKKNQADGKNPQYQNFARFARELGTDESEEAFDRALRKVGTAKPAPVSKLKKQRSKTRR